MDYLSDLQKEKIITFNADKEMVEAVKKVLLAAIYSNGTLRKDVPVEFERNVAFGLAGLASNGANLTNDQIANDLRALYEGVRLLKNGFDELAKVKIEEKSVVTPYNEAI